MSRKRRASSRQNSTSRGSGSLGAGNAAESSDPEGTVPLQEPPVPSEVTPSLLVQSTGGIDLDPQRWTLDRERFSIGRSSGNDLVLPHDSVSRQHALLEYRDGRWWVRSLRAPKNPVYVRGIAVMEEVPLASNDQLIIGPVSFLFLDPAHQSVEATLPFPIALALRQVEGAASSERRLRLSLAGLEQIWRFLLAAQLGTLMVREEGAQLRRLLPTEQLKSTRPVSMGLYVEMICSLLPASQSDGGPLGLTLRNLTHRTGLGLRQRWQQMVTLRNNLAHRWSGEQDAYEAEASEATAELHDTAEAMLPFRATSMVCRLPSDSAPDQRRGVYPVRVLQGAYSQFALREMALQEPLEPSWCYLIDRKTPVPLAPFFALATATQTRHLDLFVSRTLGSLTPGEMIDLDGLTSNQELKLPMPHHAWNRMIAG